MDSALNLHKHVFGQVLETHPDIICEVLPGEEEAVVEIHCFCNKTQMERIVENEPHASHESLRVARIQDIDDNSAFLLLRYSTQVPYSLLYELPNNLVCNSFSWFIPEAFRRKICSQSSGLEVAHLQNSGAVYVPEVETGLHAATEFESIKTIAARAECAGPEIEIITSSTQKLLSYDKSLPDNLGLLTFYAMEPAERHILPIVIAADTLLAIAKYGQLNVSSGGYLDGCVCHALLYGLYGQWIASKVGGVSI